MRDVAWYEHLEEARQIARQRGVPLAIKALGQGTNEQEDWCPAASATRALALSDPVVTALLNEHFVPVRFSMWMVGPGTDLPGRDFVQKDGHYPYPGLILADPELNVIARTKSTADVEHTLQALKEALKQRPDLNPGGASLAAPPYDAGDPAQVQFLALQRSFDGSPAADRPRSIPLLEQWIEDYAARLPDVAAMARTLLGDCHYIAGDFLAAEALWRKVVELHPQHPVRHRCSFNLLDKRVWPEATHPALVGCPAPGVAVHPPVVPNGEVRARNLAGLDDDPRYERSPGGMVFARVPAGTFTMGGSPAVYATELPTRRVTLSRPYLLAAWPVTRAQWREFRPDAWPGEEGAGLAGALPHVLVTWHEANAYCEWLSNRDGWKYRLPTEAEWERAARGGLEQMKYPWGDEPLDPERANYNLPRPVPVASYPPNAFGLFEMLGNVSEYCSDRFHGSAYSFTPSQVVDPTGPTAEQQPRDIRTVRASLVGSPFTEMISYLSWRAGNDADRASGCFGFRVLAERA
jgi:formylglycine-generating enzyme required for sulfatase activity